MSYEQLAQAVTGLAASTDTLTQKAQSTLDTAMALFKVNASYPFSFVSGKAQYDVGEISGDPDVNTSTMLLWVEGAIEYGFVVDGPKKFTLLNPEFYANGAQMRIIVNARFGDFTTSFDTFLDQLKQEYIKAASLNGRFCGSLAVAPTTRLDGTALQKGDEYHNSVDNIRYNWTGTAWVALNSSAQTLEEKLANKADITKGANVIGFADSVAPAYLKTVSDILNSGKVSIMRFIPTTQHAALYAGTSSTDFTSNFQEAFAAFTQGGELTLPPVTFNTNGLEIHAIRNLKISGSGWKSKIKNNDTTGKHAIYVRGDVIDDRVYGLDIESLSIEGNPLSGDGLRLDRLGWYDNAGREASVTNLNKLQIMNHGKNGVQVGRSATEGAGNSVKLIGTFITGNGRTGLVGIGQTNMISLLASAITKNGVDGVELNQVASTNTVSQCFIADNVRYGVYAFRCEQPMVTHNGFNRNMEGAVAFSGNPTGSVKYTEAGLIFANLFGDNGRDAPIGREISIYSSKGTNILANYFYGTGQESMIYLSDYAEGVMIAGNHFKDLTTETMLEIKPGALNLSYTFDDDVNGSTIRQILTNRLTQYIVGGNAGLFQTRGAPGDSAPRFIMNGDGTMSFGAGSTPTDVTLSRAVAGSLRSSGGLQAQTLMVADGITTPNASTGYARIYVDSADGLLKIRFSNGTIKTFTVT
ncbi:hypothetical protein D3C87_1125290 [compost metagenome]